MDAHEAQAEAIATELTSMLTNVEWNACALLGAAALMQEPAFLDTDRLPRTVAVDGVVLPREIVFGTGLAAHERAPRSEELIAACKRTIVCDAVEVLVGGLTRMERWCTAGVDILAAATAARPEDVTFNRLESGRADVRRLGLIDEQEQRFLRECAFPLRHAIRHNNGRVHHSTKTISYSASIHGADIRVEIRAADERAVNIKLNLGGAFAVFGVMREIALRLRERGRAALGTKLTRSIRARPRS